MDDGLVARFWRKVRVTPGCWEWLATPGERHGRIWFRGSPRGAHRVSYELHNGPIPAGLVVRHRCDNGRCVNPDHLELGTKADNSRDMVERGRWRGGRPRLLTDQQVEQIRTAPSGTVANLATGLGVSVRYAYQLRMNGTTKRIYER